MTSPTTGAAGVETVDALQRALAAEHAAVWVCRLVTAFLPAELATPLAEASAAHRGRRDATARLVRDHGATPVAAAPAYSAAPVRDAGSALALLVTAEADVAGAWRSAVERTDDAVVRQLAADSLTDAAVRATRWRRAAGLTPATVPFPGQA
jgi:hypothetical protein